MKDWLSKLGLELILALAGLAAVCLVVPAIADRVEANPLWHREAATTTSTVAPTCREVPRAWCCAGADGCDTCVALPEACAPPCGDCPANHCTDVRVHPVKDAKWEARGMQKQIVVRACPKKGK